MSYFMVNFQHSPQQDEENHRRTSVTINGNWIRFKYKPRIGPHCSEIQI
jgi:hypothetical protein